MARPVLPVVHAALAEIAAEAARMGIPVWLLVLPTLTPPDRTSPPDAWAAADEATDTPLPNFFGHALAAAALGDAMVPTRRAP